MFRDKPTTVDRISEALSEIGDRLAELEHQVGDRLHPRPTRAQRIRRALSRSNPFRPEPEGLARYLPEGWTRWSAPSGRDVRRQVDALRDGVSDGYDGARGYLSRARASLPVLPFGHRASFRAGRESQRLIDVMRANPRVSTLALVGGVVVVVGAAYYVSRKVHEHSEEPDYEVLRSDGAIEIRDYDPMIVAETIKSGYHEKARKVGFDTLAQYILGRSRQGKRIAMTTPVLQQLSEDESGVKGWAIRFIMPKKYTLASLPEPTHSDVRLREVEARRMAAIRFSGNFSATLASKQLMTLYNYLADHNLTQKGDPQYAFYNPPWTPGFLKRNEILIEIER